MDETEIVRGMVFIADDQAPEVAQPGKEPLHLPAPFVPAQGAPILGFRFFAIAPVRSNHVDPQPSERSIKGVGVICTVADESSG